MKATNIIFAAVLTLQAGILFAGNNTSSDPVTGEAVTIMMASLAPVTPAVATFEEYAMASEVATLAPATPAEASFEDITADMTAVTALAPAAPLTADFEDVVEPSGDFSFLAPATPAVADFE
ncbi:MAG: hypothetical protein WCK34_01420 [Bacteroidota bacterium]